MKEKFLKFTYKAGEPVCKNGKVMLLDRFRKWDLIEGVEYIIENPEKLELEKCIIIKSATFVRVDDIPAAYEAAGASPYVQIDKKQIILYITSNIVYQGEVISSDIDYKNFTFGPSGGENFYSLLPKEEKKFVDDFRSYMEWFSKNKLTSFNGSRDFEAHRGLLLLSDTETLKVETSGSGSPEQPTEVSVLKMQTLIYQSVFQEGYEPEAQEEPEEVLRTLGRLSLEESGLPFSFRLVWKSPTMMVGKLTVDGKEIEGLAKLPGDGSGSFLDTVMYLGLMELPPATLPDADHEWLVKGGRLYYIYQINSGDITGELRSATTTQPKNPEGWVKVVAIYNNGWGNLAYIQDSFNNEAYFGLVETSRKNR